MGVSRTALERRAGAAAFRAPFSHLLFLDDQADYVCGFDRSLAPVSERACPPDRMKAARRVAQAGRLPPFVPTASDGEGDTIVSALGDTVSAHGFFAPFPGFAEHAAVYAALLEFETDHGAHVGAVRADPARLAQARGSISKALQRPPPPLGVPTAPDVFLHWKVGTLGGRVTAEIHVHNRSQRPVHGVRATMKSTADFLRPVAVFGQGADVHGHELHFLGPLEPGERTVIVHFEPQAARVGMITGRIEYTDDGGGVKSVAARPLRVDASFRPLGRPDFYRPSEALQVIDFVAHSCDAWRFSWPAVVSEAFAFERAKEAVARDGCLRLLEVAFDDPMVFEAWYLGEFPKAGRGVLVEVCAWGDSRLLDIRVGAATDGELLGALAEYRRRVRELMSERFMGVQAPAGARPVPVRHRGTPPPILLAPLLVRSLRGRATAPQIAGAVRGQAAWDRALQVDLISEWAEAMDDGPGLPGKVAPPLPREEVTLRHPDDYEFLPGLVETYRRVLGPEVLARARSLREMADRSRPQGSSKGESF